MNEVLKNQPQDVQRLYDIYYKNYPKLKDNKSFRIEKVEDNIFSVSLDWINIENFDDENWKTLIDVYLTRKKAHSWETPDTNSVMDAAWYKLWICEIYNKETWEYEMFKAKYTVQLNWKLVVKERWRKISKETEEYFKIWKDISFIWYRISLTAGESSDAEYLDRIIHNKAITIFDLLRQKQDGQLTQELFDKYKDEIEKMLPDQIMDSRFTIDSKWWSSLLEKYKTQISKDVYEKSLQKIKELEIKEKRISWMLWNEFKAELDALEAWIA